MFNSLQTLELFTKKMSVTIQEVIVVFTNKMSVTIQEVIVVYIPMFT